MKYNKRRTTHNMSRTRFYQTWLNLKARCDYHGNPRYQDYGGRGIKYEWENFESFKNDMYESYLKHVEKYGERNTSIERKNVNGNYSKRNCIWATVSVQGRNKRITKKYEYNGKDYSMYELADLSGIKPSTIESRLVRGWSVKKTVETPVDNKMRNSRAKDMIKAIDAEGGGK